jgi:hypothetical protein
MKIEDKKEREIIDKVIEFFGCDEQTAIDFLNYLKED